jgi:hypothetical protein
VVKRLGDCTAEELQAANEYARVLIFNTSRCARSTDSPDKNDVSDQSGAPARPPGRWPTSIRVLGEQRPPWWSAFPAQDDWYDPTPPYMAEV